MADMIEMNLVNLVKIMLNSQCMLQGDSSCDSMRLRRFPII